jgi:DNA-binding CsgD family transcriptional regulator
MMSKRWRHRGYSRVPVGVTPSTVPRMAAPDAAAEGPLGSFVRFLAAGPHRDDVARALVAGAAVCLVHVFDPDADELRMVAAHGLSPSILERYTSLGVDAGVPIAEAFRSDDDVEVVLPAAVDEYPLLATIVGFVPEGTRMVSCPVRHRGVPIGVCTFSAPDGAEPRSRGRLEDRFAALALWVDAHGGPAPSRRAVRRRPLGLTERQERVVELAGAGRTNAQIAREVGYSTATVKADLADLYRLLGTSDRRDLIERVRRMRAGG